MTLKYLFKIFGRHIHWCTVVSLLLHVQYFCCKLPEILDKKCDLSMAVGYKIPPKTCAGILSNRVTCPSVLCEDIFMLGGIPKHTYSSRVSMLIHCRVQESSTNMHNFISVSLCMSPWTPQHPLTRTPSEDLTHPSCRQTSHCSFSSPSQIASDSRETDSIIFQRSSAKEFIAHLRTQKP